jgi:hypothetical protein
VKTAADVARTGETTMTGADATTVMIGVAVASAIIAMIGMTIVVAVRAARDMTSAESATRTTAEKETIATGGAATSRSALFPIAATMSAAEIEAAHRAAAGVMEDIVTKDMITTEIHPIYKAKGGMLGMTMTGGTETVQTLGMAALSRKGRKPSTKSSEM